MKPILLYLSQDQFHSFAPDPSPFPSLSPQVTFSPFSEVRSSTHWWSIMTWLSLSDAPPSLHFPSSPEWPLQGLQNACSTLWGMTPSSHFMYCKDNSYLGVAGSEFFCSLYSTTSHAFCIRKLCWLSWQYLVQFFKKSINFYKIKPLVCLVNLNLADVSVDI